MEENSNQHSKRERPSSYNYPLHTSSIHHLPPTEQAGLHNYPHAPAQHPSQQGAPMAQPWNPAPSPYHDGGEHRPPPGENPHPPSYQQPYPSHPYPPPPPPGQASGYGPDAAYPRQGSSSAPNRSPPVSQPSHYPPPVNGGPHDHQHHYPPPDYRTRGYGPPESPANGAGPLPLNTAPEMIAGHPPGQPPAHYPPPPHSAGPGPPPYWGPQYQSFDGGRRKPVRAAQACDSCRQRKAKCDEGRPECSHCKDNNLKCTYRDVPPQKSEKQVIAITERLESLSDDVKQMMSAWKVQEDKINRILNIQETQANQMHALTGTIAEDAKMHAGVAMVKTRSRPQTKEEPRTDFNDSTQPNINAPFLQSFDSSAAPDKQNVAVTQSDAGTKSRGLGASDLLLWPAIKELIPPNQSVSYVMDGEAERGLLRLYGCGEGEDKGDGHNGAPSPANSHSSGRIDDDNVTVTSSPSGVWGTGQLPTRPGVFNHAAWDHPGGVTPEGELLLNSQIIENCMKSYLAHMYILHPFLDPRVLRKMVNIFKQKHSFDYQTPLRTTQSAGTKRKREMSNSPSSAMGEELPIPRTSQHTSHRPQQTPIEHSISNAIILLVLALGKICSHRSPLPGPIKSSTILNSGKNAVPQPNLGYSDLPLPPSAASAPTSPYGTSNVNGMGGIAPAPAGGLQGKNMDVIPGLAYFAKAADILGELPGGVDVSHVQANLLAGLYMGQLARIIPSHWYIANACRACQILIRSTAYRENKMSLERRNLINFAFWSCLQLESDILAEMDIPSSGIIQKEGMMLREIPNNLTLGDLDDDDTSRKDASGTGSDPNSSRKNDCLRHYSNQIQLRRTLNDSVYHIYNAERQDTRPTKLINTIGENLEMWRSLLGTWGWSDDDHESDDINHARMRGKYYGAKYIINRPALHHALSITQPSTPVSRPSESPLGQSGYQSDYTPPVTGQYPNTASNRRVNEMRPPVRVAEPLEEWILKACKNCVEAAIKSTTVFDRIRPRMIITNVFGTSHAQFGNVLVLAATFNSPNPELSSLIKENTLRFLLGRTIRFLQSNQDISPALHSDAKILQYVQNKLFPNSVSGHQQQAGSATSSFSSR